MDPTTQYIHLHRAQGFSDQQMRDQFLAHGWTLAQIDHAFAAAGTPSIVQNPPQQQAVTALDQPKKYKIYRSLLDSLRSIRNNGAAFAATLAVSAIVLVVAILVFFAIAATIFKHESLAYDPKAFFIKIVITLILLLVFYTIATSFFVATSAIVLRDGLHKRKTIVRQLLLSGIKASPRIAWLSFISGLIAFMPFFVLMILSAILSASTNSIGVVIGVLLASVIGFIWFLVVSLRLAIVQQVAVFEPTLSTKQTLKRSNYLLRVGGQWFIVKGVVLLLIISIIINFLDEHNASELLTGLLTITVNILSIASLTMLYLNRAALRDCQ